MPPEPALLSYVPQSPACGGDERCTILQSKLIAYACGSSVVIVDVRSRVLLVEFFNRLQKKNTSLLWSIDWSQKEASPDEIPDP